MTDYNDGLWHSWPGTEEHLYHTGLHHHSIIAIRAVNIAGGLVEDDNRAVGAHNWKYPCLFKVVIQYSEVVKQYVEPKTIWVNEYKNNCIYVHDSKESAIAIANSDIIRTAVEYREVR
jgi:hypothetical protein